MPRRWLSPPELLMSNPVANDKRLGVGPFNGPHLEMLQLLGEDLRLRR